MQGRTGGRQTFRITVLGLGWLLAALLWPGLQAPMAAAASATAAASQPRHAVGVVIDSGREIKKVCVRFDEPELTGEEVLRRAKVQVVFAEYSLGSAVCALCGVGCPADDCFCESTTTGRYWNYSRGQKPSWRRSELGASSTTVRDGDVEGWAWGTEGAVPPWIGFESLCVDVAPSATPAARPSERAAGSVPSSSASPAPATSSARPQPSSASELAPQTPEPSLDEMSTAAADDNESTQAVTTLDSPEAEPTEATLASDPSSGGSDTGGLLAATAALLVLGLAFVFVRRRGQR